MQLLPVADLTPHPQNDYYFDDIAGEAWDEFLRSIQTSGVIEPVIINQNKVIISGHQRVRACKELGINEIMTETKQYDSDEQMLKDLIETNIRQRGIGNPNPVKFGRCIQTLERIYGIQQGRRTDIVKEFDNVTSPTTETDLAAQLGLTRQSLQNYKQLATMIPEIQDLISTGKVTATTARAIVKKLSEDDQRELANQLAETNKKFTNRELDFYMQRVQQLSNENEKIAEENKILTAQLNTPVTIEQLSADEIDSIKAAIAEFNDNNEAKLTEAINSAHKTVDELRQQVEVLQTDLLSKQSDIQSLKSERDKLQIQMETFRKEAQPNYNDCVDSDVIFNFCKQCVEFQNTVIAPIENGDAITQCATNNILYQRLFHTCKSMIDSLDRVIKKASVTDLAVVDDDVIVDF